MDERLDRCRVTLGKTRLKTDMCARGSSHHPSDRCDLCADEEHAGLSTFCRKCRSGGYSPRVRTVLHIVDQSCTLLFPRMLLIRSRTILPGSRKDTGGERRLLHPPGFKRGFATFGTEITTIPHPFSHSGAGIRLSISSSPWGYTRR